MDILTEQQYRKMRALYPAIPAANVLRLVRADEAITEIRTGIRYSNAQQRLFADISNSYRNHVECAAQGGHELWKYCSTKARAERGGPAF